MRVVCSAGSSRVCDLSDSYCPPQPAMGKRAAQAQSKRASAQAVRPKVKKAPKKDTRQREGRFMHWKMEIPKDQWRQVEMFFYGVFKVKAEFTRVVWSDHSAKKIEVDFSTHIARRKSSHKIQGLKTLLKATYLEEFKEDDFVPAKYNINWPKGFSDEMDNRKAKHEHLYRDWYYINLTEDQADAFQEMGHKLYKAPGGPPASPGPQESEDEAAGHPEYLHGPPKRLDEEDYRSYSASPEPVRR